MIDQDQESIPFFLGRKKRERKRKTLQPFLNSAAESLSKGKLFARFN